MLLRMILLTKSSKHGKLCVAGLNDDTREFVRLVSDDDKTDGAISPEMLVYTEGERIGREAERLDVIEADVVAATVDPIQTENVRLVRVKRFLRHTSIEDVLHIRSGEEDRFVLGNTSAVLSPQLALQMGRSLALARVHHLEVRITTGNEDGRRKTKASFIYHGHAYRSMSVTDPNFYYMLDDEVIYTEAVVVASIGKPITMRDTGELLHFKFVAAIYPLGQTDFAPTGEELPF